jgi:lysozyme
MSLPPGSSARDRWLDLADEARAKTRDALANGDRRMAGLWDEHERTLLRNAYGDVPFRDAAMPSAGMTRRGFNPSAAFPPRGIQLASADDAPSIGEFLMAADDAASNANDAGIPKPGNQPQRNQLSDLAVGEAGMGIVKKWEPDPNDPYTQAPDPVEQPTIGYGHKIRPKEGHSKIFDKPIDESIAQQLLAIDVGDAEDAVRRHVKVPLTQNEYDALVAFTYNVGEGKPKEKDGSGGSGLAGSTLLEKLNAGDYDGAAKEFPKFNKGRVGGKLVVLPGLVNRRAEEKQLFMKR